MKQIIEELQKAMGISGYAAKLYLAAIQNGPSTLTELSRVAKLSRTVTNKPISELLESGLFTKQLTGKRVIYHPTSPQRLPQLIDHKKQILADLSSVLLQQISASEQDLQVRWFSGMAGIHTAMMEFYKKARGPFYFWENSETYEHVGHNFADLVLSARLKRNITSRVIVVSSRKTDPWYEAHTNRNDAELRETLILSAEEYPFIANIGAGEDKVLAFEYQEKPFALIIENKFLAQSIRAIHQMVWDRYKGNS